VRKSRSRARLRVILAPAAQRDIRAALEWSEERFGRRAAARYRALLKQALRDIAAEPERPGSTERTELTEGARTYHLRFSRDRVRGAETVKEPRHFLVYRTRKDGVIEVARVLHDARNLERHLPEEYQRKGITDQKRDD
jgi:toxin ParE1/3/4